MSMRSTIVAVALSVSCLSYRADTAAAQQVANPQVVEAPADVGQPLPAPAPGLFVDAQQAATVAPAVNTRYHGDYTSPYQYVRYYGYGLYRPWLYRPNYNYWYGNYSWQYRPYYANYGYAVRPYYYPYSTPYAYSSYYAPYTTGYHYPYGVAGGWSGVYGFNPYTAIYAYGGYGGYGGFGYPAFAYGGCYYW